MTWSSKLKPFLVPAVLLLLTLVGCSSMPVQMAEKPTVITNSPPSQITTNGTSSSGVNNPTATPGITAFSVPTTPPSVTATPSVSPTAKSAQAQAPRLPSVAIAGTDLPPLAAVDLWDRMRSGFKMAELNSPLVAEKEKFYLSKPEYLQRMFNRGNRYLYFIMEEIDKRGMPMELALLPFVESAMNPTAMSHASASGLWQFIPSTGRQYNLSQNWWVDNRRDVSKATIAALEYLQRIYKMQGDDWFLALASYNWGEGSVQRAMRANTAKGLPADYISLNMPAETRHYVPKLIALRNIVMRAKELGIELPEAPNKPYFVSVEKTRPIDLKLAAQFAGMSVEEFVSLNPAHNRPVIAATKNNQILVPTNREKQFLAAIEAHAEGNKVFASWQPRTLAAGDTLESIALAGGVSVAELRQANGIKAHQRILPGTRIIAPQGKVKDETQVESFVAPRVVESVSFPALRHVVGKRENLNSISKRFGVSVASLKAWNGIKKAASVGMSLIVRPAVAQTVVTNEAGSRQVVSSNQAKVIPVALNVPEAEDQPVQRGGKAKKVTAGKTSKADTKLAKGKAGKQTAKTEKGSKAKGSKKVIAKAEGGTKGKAKVSGKTAEQPKKKATRA